MNIENLTYLVIGLLAALTVAGLIGYLIYILHRVRQVEQFLAEFPTPEEMAKQILKVKLPLNEVPPEAMDNLKEFVNKEAEKISEGKLPLERSNYIG